MLSYKIWYTIYVNIYEERIYTFVDSFYVKEENMKYKLQRKKKVWDLFRNEIKILIGIFISLTLGITTWLNWSTIVKLLDWLNLNPYEFITYFISLPFIILFMLSYLTTVIKYLYRHLYIPLTHEELEVNNIHSLKEYDDFLYTFFMGNRPLKRVQDEINLTAKNEFNDVYLEYIFCDNFIKMYTIEILISLSIGILAQFIAMTQYQNINCFLNLFAVELLLFHLVQLFLPGFNLGQDCSFFKIARIKEEK